MNVSSIITLIILAVLCTLSFAKIIKDKKAGRTCGGDCSHCGMCR